MNEIGCDAFYIELIENCPCSSKDELRAKEGEWIRRIGTLNKRIEGRTDKQYREDNKETLTEQKKKYYEENKEHITEYKKQWHEKNRDIVLGRVKNYNAEHREEKLEYYRQRYQK